MVNQMLSGPESVSDIAIATVTTLALYERAHQQLTGLVHLDGLYRMIQLRGGIARLTKVNRCLAQKPWRYVFHSTNRDQLLTGMRLDVEFALQDGGPTRFRSDDIPPSVVFRKFMANNSLEPVDKRLDQGCGINTDLRNLMCEVASLAHTLNEMDQESKIDPLDYSESVFSLLHRLIQLAPLESHRIWDPMNNLLHLTLLASMTTLLPEYGLNVFKYTLLSNKLKRALLDFEATTTRDRKFMIWAIFVGGISVLRTGDNLWLLRLLADHCEHQEPGTWPHVYRVLCEWSWIHALHDAPGRTIWEQMWQGKQG